MKNINKITLLQDEEMLAYMLSKYNEAIWENQEGQKAHFDKQLKMVQLIMRDIIVGLRLSLDAIKQLLDFGVKED